MVNRQKKPTKQKKNYLKAKSNAVKVPKSPVCNRHQFNNQADKSESKQ